MIKKQRFNDEDPFAGLSESEQDDDATIEDELDLLSNLPVLKRCSLLKFS